MVIGRSRALIGFAVFLAILGIAIVFASRWLDRGIELAGWVFLAVGLLIAVVYMWRAGNYG